LATRLPGESFVYLGDTARLPYGTKSPETIRRYLTQNIRFLEHTGVKAIVVACNSASSILREHEWGGIPIYGVIEPGAEAAARATRNGKIGVLGTRATVESHAYTRALVTCRSEIVVTQQPCPLLVPLVEEGWEEDEVTRSVLVRYMAAPLAAGIDTLILGCTHYPVLAGQIARIAGPNVTLVDSANVMAERIAADIEKGRIPRGENANGPVIHIRMTDTNHVFREVGRRILGKLPVTSWEHADLNHEREYAKL
jgi:glutamate racemase